MTTVTHLTNQSQFVQSNAVFAGTNASGTIGSSGISISVGVGGGGGAAISGGLNSQSTGTVNFSNANGVSFGLSNNGVMTATVATNYQSQGAYLTTAQPVGAYLTTAALSQDSTKYAGINGAITGGSITVNTSGVSINLPAYLTTAQPVGAYLTTAALSNHSHGNPTLALTNISGTTASNSNGLTLSLSAAAGGGGADGYNIIGVNGNTVGSANTVQFSNGNNVTFGLAGSTITASASYPAQSAFVFSNSNGVSFGTNGSTVTATVATNYQSQGAYLTTARASNDAIGLNSALTANGVSMTANSSGLSLNFPAFLTTAQPVGAYLTTGALSNHSHNFATTTTNGAVIVVGTTNSNGATIGVPSFLTTAQAPGAYLTTARASNDAVGLNTALTGNGVAWTVNSSGLSLNVPAFLTTAMASNNGSNFVQAGAAFNGTNASGTIASNGISISVDPPGGGAAVTASASNGSFTAGLLAFSNANNVTFGTSAGSIITASVAAPGAAAENNWMNALGANTAGNTTASGSTIGLSGINLTISGTNGSVFNLSVPPVSSLVGASGIQLSTAGSTISIGNIYETHTLWYPYNEGVNVLGQQGNASLHFAPVPTPGNGGFGELQIDRINIPMFITNATNSTGSLTVTMSVGLYTKNVSSLSLWGSTTGSLAITFSGTVGNSTYAGIRLATVPWSTTIPNDRYYIGMGYRTTTGGANATVSQVLVSQLNSNFSGQYGVNSNRSNQWPLGLGVLSASTTALPGSVAFSQIDGTGSLVARPPSWHMRSGTA